MTDILDNDFTLKAGDMVKVSDFPIPHHPDGSPNLVREFIEFREGMCYCKAARSGVGVGWKYYEPVDGLRYEAAVVVLADEIFTKYGEDFARRLTGAILRKMRE